MPAAVRTMAETSRAGLRGRIRPPPPPKTGLSVAIRYEPARTGTLYRKREPIGARCCVGFVCNHAINQTAPKIIQSVEQTVTACIGMDTSVAPRLFPDS